VLGAYVLEKASGEVRIFRSDRVVLATGAIERPLVFRDNDRPGVGFKPEPEAPATGRAEDKDYRNSGLARGHQAASEDFNADAAMMIDTFFFSNVVPQVGAGFNSGIWSSLERLTRDLARERGDITVITGPIYQGVGVSGIVKDQDACGQEIALPAPEKESICDANDDDPSARCEVGVAVPLALYKIIYDPGRKRVNAYLLPNLSHTAIKKSVTTLTYLKRHRVTVRLLEELVGYDFFAGFSSRRQSQLEELCPATFLH